MPLTNEERELLKTVYRNMDPNKPLEPGSPFYQPIYELLEGRDPVERLFTCIDFADVQSCQFFSGFRGSGKTTELKRLKRKLEDTGQHLVFYADALEYINPAEPIDISDLLIVLAGAFSDALDDFDPGISTAREPYWQRLWHYLTTTEVKAEEIKFAMKDVAELKLSLKDVPSFRQKIQKMMSLRLSHLENEVKLFFEDSVKALQKRHPGKKIVFMFDQLEQIRGGLFNEKDVIESVERLFRQHVDRLKLPYIHTIYTVPPWLKFVCQTLDVFILPSIRQWEPDKERTPCSSADNCLRELIVKRLPPGGLAMLFDHNDSAKQLIAHCGGHFRDLLRLFRSAIIQARSLPISMEVVNSAVSEVRSSFLPIAYNDALWLKNIADTHESGLQDTSSESVSQFTKFLDTHFVLFLRNGSEWYDIHPLIRDEVEKIAQSKAVASK